MDFIIYTHNIRFTRFTYTKIRMLFIYIYIYAVAYTGYLNGEGLKYSLKVLSNHKIRFKI